MYVKNLGVVIENIKNLPSIQSNSEIVRHLNLINKFAESDEERAYFLGSLLKQNGNSELIPSENKKALLSTIKHQGLDNYYYLHEKPGKENVDILSIFFFVGGLVLIVFGIIQLSKGGITLSTNLRYLGTIIKDGGYQILLGIILFSGGYVRYRHELNKQKFIRQLI
jgi:hypothetical protein